VLDDVAKRDLGGLGEAADEVEHLTEEAGYGRAGTPTAVATASPAKSVRLRHSSHFSSYPLPETQAALCRAPSSCSHLICSPRTTSSAAAVAPQSSSIDIARVGPPRHVPLSRIRSHGIWLWHAILLGFERGQSNPIQSNSTIALNQIIVFLGLDREMKSNGP